MNRTRHICLCQGQFLRYLYRSVGRRGHGCFSPLAHCIFMDICMYTKNRHSLLRSLNFCEIYLWNLLVILRLLL